KIDAQRADSTSALNFCPKQSNSSNLESISVGVVEPMAGKQQWKDRAYPIRTWRIRTFYGVGVGKMMHWWLKKRKKLSNPMQYMGDEDEKLHEMTSMAKRSVREKMREHNLEKELTRRRKIAMVYYQKLGAEKRFLEVTSANIQNGSLVRYPVKLKNKEQREKLVRALERRGFYLGDVWYDTVVAPSKYFGKSKYKRRSCPRGEKLAQVIFNLPTHRNISEKEARRLGEVVERLG
ncbi:DegT/DnrJ/EryC1/StrS family aminotransferase, partial [Microgenomates group bacterium]|nr:DegT/DnrJ/EryC1/StrS family aminotransferase [Microgenomates group bacterium]